MNAKWTGLLRGASVGVIAGGVALGVAELFAAFAGGEQASPLIAVGSAGITLTPEWLKEFAIRHFGTNDKLALLIGLATGITALSLLIGIVAEKRVKTGLVGFAVFGVLGAVAAVTRPTGGWTTAVPSIAGCLAGMLALALLVRGGAGPRGDGQGAEATSADRRDVLLTGAGAIVVGGASGLGGSLLLDRGDVGAARKAVRLPVAASKAEPVPNGAQIRIPGMTPFVTPNADFYRVDTALTLPQVSPRDWTLRIHGMVDHVVCGGDDESGDKAAPDSSSAPADGAATSVAAMPDKPFGAACSAVPSSGKGSFSGMAQDPVATAASNNPVLSRRGPGPPACPPQAGTAAVSRL